MLIKFTKMQGLGNDFMVLDQTREPVALSPEQIRFLADRHFGVGFDQLLLVEPAASDGVDFNYRIYNSDGREVEHCGNGARCFARFVHDRRMTSSNPVRVQTVNGVLSLHLHEDGQVTVDMGKPRLDPADIPFNAPEAAPLYTRTLEGDGETVSVEFSALSMGNPHAVVLVDNVETAPVAEIGSSLGAHEDFPQGVNVGFMQVESRNRVRLRVYERGAGETLACGTGACAAVVAGCERGLLDETVTLLLRGGELTVTWRGEGEPVLMTGPASTVFEGSIEL